MMNRWKTSIILFVGIFLFNVAVGILIAFLVHGQGATTCVKARAKRDVSGDNQFQLPECEHDNTIFNEPMNIFESFTSQEIDRLKAYLQQKGLLSGSIYTQRSNTVLGVVMYPFDKKEIDDYLKQIEQGQSVTKVPDRYAFVRVRRGARNPPDIMEYKIGPLSAGAKIQTKRLTNNGEIPFNARTNDIAEFIVHNSKMWSEVFPLITLFKESFDGAYYRQGLISRLLDPPGLDMEDRTRRYSINFVVPGTNLGNDLNPTPVFLSFNSTDTNTNRWHTHSYYYLNQGPYKTAMDLANAYSSGKLRKIKIKKGFRNKLNGRVYPHKYTGKQRENANKQPPRAYEPQGPRYQISRDIIKWMDWEFVLNIDYIRGPLLRDVRFRGERILWELALTEVALIYAHDSSHGNNILADTSFSLGEQIARSIFNVECPEHGTFMNTTMIKPVKKITVRTTCVFEADAERPLWRMKDKKFAAGMRESYLVVRVPLPIGNYDYTYEWHFHLDGSLKTMVYASGFLQAGFWDPENPHAGDNKTTDAFGFRVGEYTHGAIHDHTFAFKVDLDILGSNNTFKRMNWKADTLSKAYNKNGIPVTDDQKNRKRPANETYYMHWETPSLEAGYIIDMERPQKWVVVNENKRNKWGLYRGYQISHTVTGAQSLTNAFPGLDALSFSKYQCAVTRYHEEEMHATDNDVIGRLRSPRVSIDKYLNRENIVNKDIVLWVSVGFLHVPTAEDYPETAQTGSGFWLRPFNYFDRNPVFDMPHYFESSNGCDCRRPIPFDSSPCYAFDRKL